MDEDRLFKLLEEIRDQQKTNMDAAIKLQKAAMRRHILTLVVYSLVLGGIIVGAIMLSK
jgi:CHASE3 domain sensor protein